MTGREFEDYIVKMLGASGYWAHRISPDESGQQPFDIIALKGDVACAYDAKVISKGNRFPLTRVEDNQLNAFGLFRKRVRYTDIGCLIYHSGDIRFYSVDEIVADMLNGVKSIDVRGLPLWRCL